MEKRNQSQVNKISNPKQVSKTTQESKIPDIRPVLTQYRDNSVKKDK